MICAKSVPDISFIAPQSVLISQLSHPKVYRYEKKKARVTSKEITGGHAITSSTIPYELTFNSVPDFIQELEIVNDLFFAHQENSNQYDHHNSDDDNDEDDIHNEVASVDDSGSDVESVKQEAFFKNTCGCKKHNNQPCSSVLNRELIVSYRYSMLEKSKLELYLIIKSQLFQHRNTSDETKHGKNRQRPSQVYFFAGKTVCRQLFAFVHGVHRNTVDAIARSLDQSGLEERVHGNTKTVPWNALTTAEVQYVKNFLCHYATQNGVPLPGRTANYRDEKSILLPSDRNKVDVFNLFREAADEAGIRKVSLRTFYRLWKEHCPHILVMQPATDLCATCQRHANQILHSGNSTEEEKQQQLAAYNTHLEKVQCQRQHYRDDLETSKEAFQSLSPDRAVQGQVPSSVPVVYSFDFAQQVLYPHYAQQVGPIFFKTPRKCACFGVCCESSGTQMFYLLDEGEGAGKGANSVTSMLHHYFQTHGYGEQHVKLNMDNCSGQNKNNTVIGYFLWRTLTGAHTTVEISLMEAGHTKFSPDWHFGLWKVRWRHSSAETMGDIAETVRHSSRNGHNLPQLVKDPQHPVGFFDWKTFLKPFFKTVPNISRYHYFRMTGNEPGKLFMRQYMFSEEVTFTATKPANPITGFPERINPQDLDPARQWYLFDEIRPYCNNSAEACPQPTIPRPRPYKSEGVTSKSNM